ncbi:hypothetical protein [Mesorhizobium sp. CN2-181]|uniref:hypothetical protein n=1 Tax=Mesorhizobium yinganensis TaxID=3157707 RepID=UPI0032B742D3
MAYMDDLLRYGTVPVANTPSLMGGSMPSFGASNPTGVALQAAASAPSTTGSVSGGGGLMDVVGPYSTNYHPPAPNAPGAGKSFFGNMGLMDWGQLAIGGIGTAANIWNAWEQNKLAKEQLKFQKEAYNTNMANQIQSYNTQLEDRTRARQVGLGMSDEEAQAYIDKHQLRR